MKSVPAGKPSTSTLPRNYTIQEAAERIPSTQDPDQHVSCRTVRRWVDAGILRATSTRGRTHFVNKADVEFLMVGGSPDELLRRHLAEADRAS